MSKKPWKRRGQSGGLTSLRIDVIGHSRPVGLTQSMTKSHTDAMSVSKVTISIDESLLKRVDRLVRSRIFPNRSHVIQQAIEEKIARIDSSRLARECAKLNPAEEQALADEGMAGEAVLWPEY